jgi:hypothetical protein
LTGEHTWCVSFDDGVVVVLDAGSNQRADGKPENDSENDDNGTGAHSV